MPELTGKGKDRQFQIFCSIFIKRNLSGKYQYHTSGRQCILLLVNVNLHLSLQTKQKFSLLRPAGIGKKIRLATGMEQVFFTHKVPFLKYKDSI